MKLIALLFVVPALVQGTVFDFNYSISCNNPNQAFNYEFQLFEKDSWRDDNLVYVKGGAQAGQVSRGSVSATDSDGDEVFSSGLDVKITIWHNCEAEYDCDTITIGSCSVDTGLCRLQKDIVLKASKGDNICGQKIDFKPWGKK